MKESKMNVFAHTPARSDTPATQPRLGHLAAPPRRRLAQALGLISLLLCLDALPVWSVTLRWAGTSNRIYVTGPGSATLTDIKTALPKAPLTQTSPGLWQLRANIQIEQGGGLVLHGTAIGGDVDELRLQSNNSATANSYVNITADWGSIDLLNAKVTSWDDAAGGPDTEYASYGRAFIRVRSSLDANGVTAHESRLDVVNSEAAYLGFDNAESYGLVWKVIGSQNNLYNLVNVYGDIQNSRLHHNWFGAYTYGAFGMQIQNNEFDHNVKYGLDPHDDSDALLIEGNHSHHNGDHGIIASQRCDHIIIRNNLSEYNIGNGIMLHRSSDDGTIVNNTCQNNSDSGIALFDCQRTTVQNNACLANGQSGIRLSVGSADNLIENNELAGSPQYGVFLYQGSDPPHAGDDGRPKRNEFANNSIHNNAKEGVKLGDSDNNQFVGNQFAANGSILRFSRGVGNLLDGNEIPSGVNVKTEGNSSFAANTIVRNQPLLLVQVDPYSSVTFADDLGAVFDPDEAGLATTVAPNGSTLTLASVQIGTSSTVAPRNLAAVPNSGGALVEPTVWNLTGNLSKAWTTLAAASSQRLSYTVGDLAANQPYNVLKNGGFLIPLTSDSSGIVRFNDQANTPSSIQYQVVPAP